VALELGLAILAKNRHFKERQGVDFMVGRLCPGETIRITGTAIAPRHREGKHLTVTPT
jgi:hypothetical protein